MNGKLCCRRSTARVRPHLVIAVMLPLCISVACGQDTPASELLESLADVLASDNKEDKLRYAEELADEARAASAEADYALATADHDARLKVLQQVYPEKHKEVALAFHRLGMTLLFQGDYARAESVIQRAIDLHQSLLKTSEDPKRTQQLIAAEYANLGTAFYSQGKFDKAIATYKSGLQQQRRLFPRSEFPNGNANLASTIAAIGTVMAAQADFTGARKYQEEALAMQRALTPPAENPHGSQKLATNLLTLGFTLQRQGELEEASSLLTEAESMFRGLYPEDQHPNGHPYLAICVNNLAEVHAQRGEFESAARRYDESYEMFGRLYPASRYPSGHPRLAKCLHNLGSIRMELEQFDQALTLLSDARTMFENLDMQSELVNLWSTQAKLHQRQGEYKKAREACDESLKRCRVIYASDRYPNGHPLLAACLHDRGIAAYHLDELNAAAEFLAEAAAMNQSLAEEFTAAASEAESLNYLSTQRKSLDALMTVELLRDATDSESLYRHFWDRQGLVQRQIARRNRTLAMATDVQKQEYIRYQSVRRRIAQLVLAPASNDPRVTDARRQELDRLTSEKESRERELAAVLSPRHVTESEGAQAAIREQLPRSAAVVDFFRYVRYSDEPGRVSSRYVAFIIQPDREPVCVELGAAEEIDALILSWRSEIEQGGTGDAGARLSQKVWQPLKAELPLEPSQLCICPDGQLATVPWSALPQGDHRVLIELCPIALVPHPEQLVQMPAQRHAGLANVLLVGDVDYTATAFEEEDSESRRRWPALPGTAEELKRIQQLFPGATSLTGADATADRVLQELTRSRTAHLATHGFFADPEFRRLFDLDSAYFQTTPSRQTDRHAIAGRNPLVLSGLVLAGGSHDAPAGKNKNESGILTAESIAGQPLENLDMVVLSACETGLGEVAGGEGVFGLQRAFHIAGTNTVIAALWKVDDQATQALMHRFYTNLQNRRMSKLEALREAQLWLFHHPDSLVALGVQDADSRGLLKQSAAIASKTNSLPPRTNPYFWAGFQLSGDWR